MVEQLTNSDPFKVIASIVTGGAFVGWYREHRKARKDANTFAIEFMREQSQRIDALVREVAELKASINAADTALMMANETLHQLRNDLFQARMDVKNRDSEITRLKTALGEHGRTD